MAPVPRRLDRGRHGQGCHGGNRGVPRNRDTAACEIVGGRAHDHDGKRRHRAGGSQGEVHGAGTWVGADGTDRGPSAQVAYARVAVIVAVRAVGARRMRPGDGSQFRESHGGTGEVGAREVGAGQIRVAQIGRFEVGTGQVGVVELSVHEERSPEDRARQVRSRQVR